METRERILQEARELLLSEGFNRFSMRAVALRVGVSATAIYRHYQDKEALLAGLVDEAFSIFLQFLTRALAGRDALERFKLTGRGYFDFALQHPQRYKLMFLVDCRELGLAQMSEEISERAQASFRFLVDRIAECIEAGVFAPGAPEQLALSVWAHTHGLSSLYLLGQLEGKLTQAQFAAQIELSLQQIERALLPAGALPQ